MIRKTSKRHFNFVSVKDAQCVYREVSTVDTFYKIKGVSSDDGKDCVSIVDPIFLLFDDKRLKRLGSDSAANFIDSLIENFRGNHLIELRKQCSDDDLLATIKSRHLQRPSEILAWTRYMSNNMDEFKSKVAAVKAEIAEQQKQTEQQTKSTAAAE